MEHTNEAKIFADKENPSDHYHTKFIDAFGSYTYSHYLRSAGSKPMGLHDWSGDMRLALEVPLAARAHYYKILVINSQESGNKFHNGANKEPLTSSLMGSDSILAEANSVIYGEREKTYGDPGKNLRMIAGMWSVYLGIPVTPNDVCNMMVQLKVARLKTTPEHRDSMVDICGYTALMERVQGHDSYSNSPSKPEAPSASPLQHS